MSEMSIRVGLSFTKTFDNVRRYLLVLVLVLVAIAVFCAYCLQELMICKSVFTSDSR